MPDFYLVKNKRIADLQDEVAEVCQQRDSLLTKIDKVLVDPKMTEKQKKMLLELKELLL